MRTDRFRPVVESPALSDHERLGLNAVGASDCLGQFVDGKDSADRERSNPSGTHVPLDVLPARITTDLATTR